MKTPTLIPIFLNLQQLLTSVFTRGQLNKTVQLLSTEGTTKIDATDHFLTSSIPHETALHILDQEIRLDNFTPEDFWIVGCMEPYKAMKSNHELMMKDNKMTVSKLSSKDGSFDGKIVAISFCNIVPCSAGLRHRLDFYPHVDYYLNAELLMQHVRNNLEYLCDKYRDYKIISFSVILPNTHPKSVLYKTFKHLELPEFREVPSLCIVGKGLPFNVKSVL